MITNGLSTQIHSAAAPSAPTWRATRGAAQISKARPGSMHSRRSIVPATTLLPTSIVTNFATRMKAGPYGAVVVVQIGLTLSSNELGLSTGPTAYGPKPSRNRARRARSGVEAVGEQGGLRQVGVGVAAEHRNRPQQRSQPEAGGRHHRVFACR